MPDRRRLAFAVVLIAWLTAVSAPLAPPVAQALAPAYPGATAGTSSVFDSGLTGFRDQLVPSAPSSDRIDPRITATVNHAGPGVTTAAIVVRSVSAVSTDPATDTDRVPAILSPQAITDTNTPVQVYAPAPGVVVERDFPLVGVSLVRIEDPGALAGLAGDPTVRAVVPEQTFTLDTAESGPVVHAPQAQARGYGGAGSYVAVIDTGTDYTRLGCAAPGEPASCPVAYVAPDFSTDDYGLPSDDGSLDDSGHGTNVSGIVAAIAPDARIIVIDVFRQTLVNGVMSNVAKTSDIAAAFQYVLQLRNSGVPIRAVNLSLGSSDAYTSPCTDTIGNGALSAAGIVTVAAAGNAAKLNGVGRIGLSSPACVAGVVSVGATYDTAAPSGVTSCGDTGPVVVDQITCFSQVSQYLSLLAPGRSITAGGYTYSGTSQASPHVAAAVALLAGFAPGATGSQIVSALTTSGPPINDPRIGLSFRRLDIDASVTTLATSIGATTNDAFDQAVDLTGASGSLTVPFNGATVQGGETRHGDRTGVRTAWFRWTAPVSGRFTLLSAGSTFDTAMSIYSGTRLGLLTELAANDDSDRPDNTATLGPVEVVGGTIYHIAVVCGQDLAGCGSVSLQWNSDATLTAPDNDLPSQATVLGSSGSLTQSNAYATAQGGETPINPADLSYVRSRSVWFKLPSGRGQLSVSTRLSNFDTTLTTYVGPDPQHLTVSGRSDDVGPTATGVDRTSSVTATSALSGWNWIAVDGFDGETGTVALTWTLTADPVVPSAPATVGPPSARTAAPQANSPLASTARVAVPSSGEDPVIIP